MVQNELLNLVFYGVILFV